MRRENDVCQGRSFAVPPTAPSSPAPHSKARAARYGVTARAQRAAEQTPQAAHAMQGQSSAPAQAMPPSNFGRGLPGANGQQQFVLLPKPFSSQTAVFTMLCNKAIKGSLPAPSGAAHGDSSVTESGCSIPLLGTAGGCAVSTCPTQTTSRAGAWAGLGAGVGRNCLKHPNKPLCKCTCECTEHQEAPGCNSFLQEDLGLSTGQGGQ